MVLFFERRMTAVWSAFGLFRPSSRYPQKLATKSCVPIMTTEADEVYDWLPSLARRNRRSRRIDKGVSCSNLELKERGGVVQGHSGFSVVLPPAETSSPPDFEQSLRAVFSNNQGWRQNSWGSNAYTDIHSGMHSITLSMSVSSCKQASTRSGIRAYPLPGMWPRLSDEFGIFDRYLDDNELASLPANAFTGLSSAVMVHLHNNALTTLPDGVFKDLGSGDGGSLFTM